MEVPLYYTVAREALRVGLRCQPMEKDLKHVSIGGHRCQILSSATYQSGKHTVIPLYLPRPRWADFLIYVARYRDDKPAPSFFIVPRDKTRRHGTVSSAQSWLFEYKDAWAPLLSMPHPLDDSKKPIETVNWKLAHVLAQAKNLGYRADLIPMTHKHFKHRLLKNRLLVNELKCHVATAPRMSKDPSGRFWNGIHLYVTKQTWADFLIYIVKPDDERTTFIIPRTALPCSTTTFITSDWLQKYRENWGSLKCE